MIETIFTPWPSLFGGILIGLAATLLMLVAGRIMGMTGILAGLLRPVSQSDLAWRAVLVLGMVSGPLVVRVVTGQMPVIEVPSSWPMLLIGGLLVGIGASFGSGCTSGHGVCGMARLSLRSIIATIIFMVTTFLTVFVIRHVIGA